MRDGRALVVAAIVAASALCVATVDLRTRHTGDSFYRFLDWNLALAWVPFIAALAAYGASRRGVEGLPIMFGVIWLLFFPNAPYMLTDFIHLQETPAVPLWYDALMLSAFAWTGLLLGFASLYLMQMIWRRRVGPVMAWLGSVGVLALASFGVYLGRFLRFNSWDALVRPRRIAHVIDSDLENPFQHPRLFASLVGLTLALTVGYLLIYSIARLRLELNSSRQLEAAANDQRSSE